MSFYPAWEVLFERLGVVPAKDASGDSLLIIGAAGGVGSVLTQIARRLTGLTVTGTASRRETADWVTSRGAHHVIDHSKPLSQDLKRIGIPNVTYVASMTKTDQHYAEIAESLLPQGRFALIGDVHPLGVSRLKRKSVSVHLETMFTRPIYETPDMIKHHEMLAEIARLVDSGVIRTTFRQHFGTINAENLKRAHALTEAS